MAWKKVEVLEKYIERGWPIFPLHWLVNGHCSCGSPNCSSPGKHPKVNGGFKAASTDLKLVAAWDRKWPQANWGMRTGSLKSGGSGILVVDLDTKNQGPQTWEMLIMDHPERVDTVTVHSGGGGIHLWYRYPEDQEIKSSAGVLGPGIDIRANDGYIIIPPSRTQRDYAFDLRPSETSILDAPAWLLAELKQSKAGGQDSFSAAENRVSQGNRHDALVKKAIDLRMIRLGFREIVTNLMTYREQWFELGDHPVPDSEVKDVARWVCSLSTHFPETDLGNAERFANQYIQTVRYCPDWNQWLVYDGRVWERNALEAAFDKAYLTIRSIYAEAENISDEKVKEKRLHHAFRSEAGGRMDSIVRHGRNLLRIKAREYDQHHDLLTVMNGVVDLRTGELLPHDPDYKLTRMVRVHYDPTAACPYWSAFLDLVCEGDQELIDYLQAAAGYSLTGRTGEQVLFFIFGPGYGGKTTFIEGLELISGDYFERINIKALLDTPSTGQGPTPEVAKLEGARLAVSTEVPENKTFDEALIKDLTGSDSLTARAMYRNPGRFKATHKIWLFGNYKPNIQGTDDSIWRRVRLIPFGSQIPAGIRVSHDETRARLEAEASGILSWGVAGAVRLNREKRLRTPLKVAQATAQYRTDQDVVGVFIEECCRVGKGLRVLKKNIYSAWRRWTESNGEQAYMIKSQAWFSRRLKDRDLKIGGAGKAYILGVDLKR
jgi:putative DNA primase/helicase